jgi:hypothetical protein
METRVMRIESNVIGFCPIDESEARDVDGGFAVNPVTAGAAVAIGVALVGGALLAGVAVGYLVNKEDCPEDEPTSGSGSGSGTPDSDAGDSGV